MNFWKDGFDLIDFEKVLLGFLLVVVVTIGSVKYFLVGDITENWVNVIMIVGGLFTVRKIFSYFKKDAYYNQTTEQIISQVNQEGENNG